MIRNKASIFTYFLMFLISSILLYTHFNYNRTQVNELESRKIFEKIDRELNTFFIDEYRLLSLLSTDSKLNGSSKEKKLSFLNNLVNLVPHLEYSIVINKFGRVISHSERQKNGKKLDYYEELPVREQKWFKELKKGKVHNDFSQGLVGGTFSEVVNDPLGIFKTGLFISFPMTNSQGELVSYFSSFINIRSLREAIEFRNSDNTWKVYFNKYQNLESNKEITPLSFKHTLPLVNNLILVSHLNYELEHVIVNKLMLVCICLVLFISFLLMLCAVFIRKGEEEPLDALIASKKVVKVQEEKNEAIEILNQVKDELELVVEEKNHLENTVKGLEHKDQVFTAIKKRNGLLKDHVDTRLGTLEEKFEYLVEKARETSSKNSELLEFIEALQKEIRTFFKSWDSFHDVEKLVKVDLTNLRLQLGREEIDPMIISFLEKFEVNFKKLNNIVIDCNKKFEENISKKELAIEQRVSLHQTEVNAMTESFSTLTGQCTHFKEKVFEYHKGVDYGLDFTQKILNNYREEFSKYPTKEEETSKPSAETFLQPEKGSNDELGLF